MQDLSKILNPDEKVIWNEKPYWPSYRTSAIYLFIFLFIIGGLMFYPLTAILLSEYIEPTTRKAARFTLHGVDPEMQFYLKSGAIALLLLFPTALTIKYLSQYKNIQYIITNKRVISIDYENFSWKPKIKSTNLDELESAKIEHTDTIVFTKKLIKRNDADTTIRFYRIRNLQNLPKEINLR